MLLRRLYDDQLAQASYLIGCSATGEAMVVDPNRDVEQYLRAAEGEGLRITAVTETHIHADFVSGTRELAHRTGATMYLSDEGDEGWKYGFPDPSDDAAGVRGVLIRDGDVITIGNIRVQVMATPGHTPEHVSFMVTDTAGANEPMGIFTGDFVFVGDVGRPDLLERAAGFSNTMEEGARTLFRSLQRLRDLPEWLQIWPGHGAGSACGKALGAVPQTTLGYELRFNWGLSERDEQEFVRMVLAGQPEPPRYFAEMKRINRDGPTVLGGARAPRAVPAGELSTLLADGAMVVDLRSARDFASGHIPGTLNIPHNRSFTTWAGSLLTYDRDFYLIVPDSATADVAARELERIGLDRLAGYFTSSVIQEWLAGGRQLGVVEQVSVADLAGRMVGGALEHGELAVVDVRGSAEWEGGHVPSVPNIPLGSLAQRLGELPRDIPLVVHCQSGARSSISASLLRREGFTNVVNLVGGMAAWRAEGHPVERPAVQHELPSSVG